LFIPFHFLPFLSPCSVPPQPLGAGLFGQTEVCHDRLAGGSVITKRISLHRIPAPVDLINDISFLSKLTSKTIVRYNVAVHKDSEIHVITEFAKRPSLAQLMSQCRTGKKELSERVLQPLSSCLTFAHDLSFVGSLANIRDDLHLVASFS
jgi:hypothetical protein